MTEGSPTLQTAPVVPPTPGNANALTFVVRDAEGRMQVWEGGALRPFETGKASGAPQAHIPPPPVPLLLRKEGGRSPQALPESPTGGRPGADRPAGAGALSPAIPTFPQKTAAFYFSTSDAAEALAAGQVQKFLPAPAKQFSLQKIVSKLLPHLPQLSQEQQRRLGQVALTYLRGVRGLIDAKEILERPVAQGGVGLPNDPRSANDPGQIILLSLRNVREQINTEGGVVVDAPSTGTQPPPVPLLRKGGGRTSQASSESSIEGKRAPQAFSEHLLGQAASAPASPDQPVQPVVKLTVSGSTGPLRRPTADADKPSTADVRRTPPKLVGPMEELAGVTVEVFRRLGATPQQAAHRLAEKIELLGQESATRGSLGMQSWRQSSVYLLYLQLGRLALDASLPVERIIEERQRGHQPTLTMAEFQAIAELNAGLRI